MSLPVNEQKWLAATVQHCSEALATRADLECLRGLIGHVEPPETSDLWDQQLEKNRGRLLRSFCERLDEAAAKLHPTNDHMAEATRRRFNERLKLCLRVGLSKHDPVRPNMTLFGKTKLGPACVACDRPFDTPTDADAAITQMKGFQGHCTGGAAAAAPEKGTIVQRAAARGPDMFFPDVGSPVRRFLSFCAHLPARTPLPYYPAPRARRRWPACFHPAWLPAPTPSTRSGPGEGKGRHNKTGWGPHLAFWQTAAARCDSAAAPAPRPRSRA